jgi:hypothetical protein
MADLKAQLERIATRVEDRPDGFARLERRRRVRSGIRRLTAGVVAIGIGAVGTVTAASLFGTPRLQLPGGPDGQIAALWPEHDAEQLRATQEAVDTGDPSAAWRLDPEETAVRFARSVLGWTDQEERLHHQGVEAPNGLFTVDVFTVPASCDEESCDVVHEAIVQLLRLGDEGGIWSVISAESSSFNMQFRIGQVVRPGDDLEVISGHPTGTEITVGVDVFEPCTGSLHGTATVRDLRVRIPVRGVEEGCLAYVYALTPATEPRRDGSGRGLFDDRPGPDGAIDTIAVAPVFIVAAGDTGSVSEVPQPEEA